MAARKTKDEGTEPTTDETTEPTTEALANDGGPGTDPETGAPGDVVKAKTMAEAQADAIAAEGDTTVTTTTEQRKVGYFGTSPVREATGLQDKGLSQRNASVMNQGADTESDTAQEG
jgi:hypothetical protein